MHNLQHRFIILHKEKAINFEYGCKLAYLSILY